MFIHVTVVPVVTFSSSGMYARFPSDSAPVGIATDDDVDGSFAGGGDVGDGDMGDGDVGDGEVDGDAPELPHAASSADTVITEANRTKRIGASFFHME